MSQTDRFEGIASSAAIKIPCRAATTANITLSGEQTIDGVSLSSGDRVLVKDQTTTSENGVYVADVGGWTRAVDFNGTRDVVAGTIVTVSEGTSNAGEAFKVVCGDDPIVIGTSSITFSYALQTASAVEAAASAAAAAASAASAAASAQTVLNEKLIWMGAYSAVTAYAKNDAVSSGGSSYISKVDGNLNNAPPNATYWDVLASKGDAGAGSGDLLAANNLSDLNNAQTARGNIGIKESNLSASGLYEYNNFV